MQLPYVDVSKHHAMFLWSDADTDAFFLTDGGSRNGTFVDGKRLTPGTRTLVEDRSIIGFGDRYFRFHYPAGLYEVVGALVYGRG